MANPSEIDMAHIQNGLIVSACAFGALIAFDRLVARRFKRAYFALHVFAKRVPAAARTSDCIAKPARVTRWSRCSQHHRHVDHAGARDPCAPESIELDDSGAGRSLLVHLRRLGLRAPHL